MNPGDNAERLPGIALDLPLSEPVRNLVSKAALLPQVDSADLIMFAWFAERNLK